jgi:hypothetical protein
MLLILVLNLLISILPIELFAQVTQGGPPDDDLRQSTTVNWKVDDASIISLMDIKAKKLMPSLEKALKRCLLNKKKKVQIKDISEFYQVYLLETFFETFRKIEKELDTQKSGGQTNEQPCSQEDGLKKKCMQELVNQEALKDFLNTSVAGRYLELKLSLSSKEALALLKAFQELEKK